MDSLAPTGSQPPTPPDLELFCPSCGYSLRGIESERCPECGFPIERSAVAVSRIPWEHRRRLGRARAYWRTIWMSSRTVAGDVMRPVSYRDARRFQLLTVLIASLPLAAMAALPLPPGFYNAMGSALRGWPMTLPPPWAIDLGLPLFAAAGLHVVVPLAILLYLLGATGVPSYFFHPPHLTVVQQNRAIAVSYYACAPLVLLVLPGLVGWVYLLLSINKPDWTDQSFLLAAFLGMFMTLAPVAVLLMVWVNYIRTLRFATLCSTTRAIALAVTLPLLWVVMAALILIGLPWLVGFGMLVYWSFQ